ncbi:MAG: porin family protein [Flavobacteriaceae bacterium]|nr:porin family protein [Flavobacteriaceae bacterium]
MKIRLLILALLIYFVGFTQNKTDSLFNYLEDQLYFSVLNNNLINTPDGFKTYGFSNGISFGFIKDIPLNNRRNIGIGIGLGYASDTFKNNLKMVENNGLFQFSLQNENYDTNKISTKAIEVPLEFRWRTSTPDKFKFWRIYSGIKVSYLYKNEYTFIDSSINYKINNPEKLNEWQYGLTLSAGYSSFNLYTYFGLNPLYNNVKINNENTSIRVLKVGLIFYIL